MSDDQGGGVLLQGELHDLAGVHAGAIDRAAEELLELDQPVALVEIETALTIYWIAI